MKVNIIKQKNSLHDISVKWLLTVAKSESCSLLSSLVSVSMSSISGKGGGVRSELVAIYVKVIAKTTVQNKKNCTKEGHGVLVSWLQATSYFIPVEPLGGDR